MSATVTDCINVPPVPSELLHLARHLDREMPDAEWRHVIALTWLIQCEQAYLSGLDAIASLVVREWIVEGPAGQLISSGSGARYGLSDEGRRIARAVLR